MAFYHLDDDDKPFFRKGVGSLINKGKPHKNTATAIRKTEGRLYTVGDICTQHVLETETKPDLIIFDRTTERHKQVDLEIDTSYYTHFQTNNPAGQISEDAFQTIQKAIKHLPAAIEVEGEEDLLTAALILLADPGDTVIYGDPGLNGEEGLRYVTITPTLQHRLRTLFGVTETDETSP